MARARWCAAPEPRVASSSSGGLTAQRAEFEMVFETKHLLSPFCAKSQGGRESGRAQREAAKRNNKASRTEMSTGKEPAGAPGSAAQEDPEYQAGVTAIKAKDYASVGVCGCGWASRVQRAFTQD